MAFFAWPLTLFMLLIFAKAYQNTKIMIKNYINNSLSQKLNWQDDMNSMIS